MINVVTTNKSSAWLLDYSQDIFSQSGEDGIIAKILKMLPETDKWCVEFGASDGVFCSNTRNLILHHNYSAVLIESDPKAFAKLQENYQSLSNIKSLCDVVGFEGSGKLDYILSVKTHRFIPNNFDLLSVDVDGNDYHVWESMGIFNPKVVCIEYNPSIPTEVEFIQPADVNLNQGSSLRSIVDLGKQKGYELVCVTKYNAIFVREEYYRLFEISDNDPFKLRMGTSQVMYIFPGYDGHIFLRG